MYKGKNIFDFSVFFTAILLWICGIFVIYSAVYIHESGPLAGLHRHQMLWVGIGITVVLVIVSLPTKFIFKFSYVFYILSIIMLIYVIVSGTTSKGAERWIGFAGIRVQPSEFAKIGLLLALAKYFSEKKISLFEISSLVFPLILIGIPFILVLNQPDLGTAIVFLSFSLPMFFWAGMSILEIFYLISPVISVILSGIPLVLAFGTSDDLGIAGAIPWGIFFLICCGIFIATKPPKIILIAGVLINLVAGTVTNILWNEHLKDYQKERIISFIDPQSDPYGAGYQLIQSQVAIGSGHILGKGYLNGTQTRLSYLPEQHTDFIFSVFGEQFGFIGCITILLVFLFFLLKSLRITRDIKNRYTNLLITGAVSIICFHTFVNIAMITGMMPVTGLPLPFLSYGGSFTLTVAVLTGFILNARVHDQDF